MMTTNKNHDMRQIGNNPSIIEVESNSDLDEEFKKYADNFSKAADLTIRHMIESGNNGILDTWYYPLVYLYRQSLELILKACILKKITSKTDRQNTFKKISHDLGLCIDEIYNLYNLSPNDSKNAMWLDAFIKDISKVDNKSDLFRYPFNTEGKTAASNQKNISLKALYTNMNRAFEEVSSIYNNGLLSGKKFPNENPELIIEDNSQLSSNVGWRFEKGSYEPYLLSYEESGAFLMKEARSNQTLFLPACYMYRNSIELLLKRIIKEDSYLSPEKKDKIIHKRKHSIEGLWNSVETCMQDGGMNVDANDLNNFRILATSLHKYDQGSSKFRYPCDKDADLFFGKKEVLDINNVEDVFTDFTSTLNGIHQILDEKKTKKNSHNSTKGLKLTP